MRVIQVNRLQFVLFFLSLFIVSLGDPSRVAFLGILSSFCGFALFWFSIASIENKKKQFTLSMFWCALVQLVQLSWFGTTTYHGMMIFFPYLFFVFAIALQFALFSMLVLSKKKLDFFHILSMSSIWVLLEYSRLYFLCGFPFNPCGVALSCSSLTIQLASFGGVYFLSFLVVLLNLMLFNLFLTKKKKEFCSLLIALSFLMVFSSSFFYLNPRSSKEGEVFKVLALQPAIKVEEKYPMKNLPDSYKSPYDMWWMILKMSNQFLSNKTIDLIVLPEMVVCYGAYSEVYSLEDIKIIFQQVFGAKCLSCMPKVVNPYVSNLFIVKWLSKIASSDVIAGFLYTDSEMAYNSSFYISPNENLIGRYDKIKLVPLGEYLPSFFPKKAFEIFGISSFFTSGNKKTLFKGKKKYFPSICFDECFSSFYRDKNLEEPDLFVNITNDSWFYPSNLAKQHMHLGRIRAVEYGTPVIRSCNTGITAFISANGEIKQQLPEYQKNQELYRGPLFGSIDLMKIKTVYSNVGDFLILALCFISILFSFLKELAQNKKFILLTSRYLNYFLFKKKS